MTRPEGTEVAAQLPIFAASPFKSSKLAKAAAEKDDDDARATTNSRHECRGKRKISAQESRRMMSGAG